MSIPRAYAVRILQLLSADDWFGMWIFFDEGIENLVIEYHPLAFWALVDTDEGHDVVGFDAGRDISPADYVSVHTQEDDGGFFEYVHKSTLEDDVKREELENRVKMFAEKCLDPNSVPSMVRRGFAEENRRRNQ